MSPFYLGAEVVEAWYSEKDRKPGYAVRYQDGHLAWKSKEVFEATYMHMDMNCSVKLSKIEEE